MAGPIDIRKVPVSSRLSFFYFERGYLEVDGYAVVLRQKELRTHIPVGATTCLMVGPGVVVTHDAVRACADEGTLLVWTGEQGVRCYSAGFPGGKSGEHIRRQAVLREDPKSHMAVVRRLYEMMWDQEPPMTRSIEQLRGIEGRRVKQRYKDLAREFDVPWKGRRYEVEDFDASDAINKAISAANYTLYCLAEAVIMALGYTPAIGFIHSGHSRSFAFDVADVVKMSTTVPLAFQVTREKGEQDIEHHVRLACRNLFKDTQMPGRLVGIIEKAFEA